MSDLVILLFVIRIIPLAWAGVVSTKRRNYLGVLICLLYICVTTVNLVFVKPALNAVFSTPLVFLTAWYIIKTGHRPKIKIVKEK